MGRRTIRTIKRGTRGDTGGNGSADSGTLGTVEPTGVEGAGEPDEPRAESADGNQPSSSGVDGNGPSFVDPASLDGSGDNQPDGGTGKRRRGRPAGLRNKRTSTTQATADISSLLFSLHLGMAAFLKADVVMLTEEESQRLGAAITRVTDLYDIRILPEKYMAWINLAIVGGSIYGPRVVVLARQPKKQPATVVNFPQAGPVPVAAEPFKSTQEGT